MTLGRVKAATKTRGRPVADPNDRTRYARALDLACAEVNLAVPHMHALVPCPRCGVLSTAVETTMHLSLEHSLPVPQSAARVLVRVLVKHAKRARLQETK